MKKQDKLRADYGPTTAPKTIWLRIVRGRVIESFLSAQEANASEDQEHIHAYDLAD
jgi:hypothetical protein